MNRSVISSIGSERATVGDGNKIVTHEDQTHIVWQDITRGGYLNQICSYDHNTGQWSDPITLGHGVDNHARPIIINDHQGYLHVVLGGHNSPVTWRKSHHPNDSSAWTDPEPVGEGPYPVLLCGHDDTLYLTLRANRHAGVDFYAKPKDQPWQSRSRIVKNAEEYREAYGAFHMSMMEAPDHTIHAVIDFYEGQDEHGRGLHQAVCYTCSRDGGLSWEKFDGTSITIPARPENMDILARSIESRVEKLPRPEIISQGLLVDSDGQPYILFLSHREQPGQLFLFTFDTHGTIQKQALHPHIEKSWPDSRITECRATISSDDTIFILATLTPYNDQWIKGKPSRALKMVERTDEHLILITTKDLGKTCEVSTIIEPGSSLNAVNLETPLGANIIPAGTFPTFIYFDGTRGYPGGGDYYDKPVSEYLKTGDFAENNVIAAGIPPQPL